MTAIENSRNAGADKQREALTGLAETATDSADRGGSPPCFLHELSPDAGGLPDEQTHRDVMRWRRAERARLIAERQAVPVAQRQAADLRLAEELTTLLGDTQGRTIGLYWPFKGEPDLRAWAAQQRNLGARIALPVVVQKAEPLQFRLWEEGAHLQRGVWNIPIPGGEAPEVQPDIVIAPVVGFDPDHYRLGYSGGFYDRTLARIAANGGTPVTVGVGYALQRIATIYPQPHDIALQEAVIVAP